MLISVVIPARNEGHRVTDTIRSMADSRADLGKPVEFIIVDDASSPPLSMGDIKAAGVSVRLVRSKERLGVPRARNLGASHARGDILVMTDAHVRFTAGWDLVAALCERSPLLLAATVADPTSNFRGHGCSLVIPFMGTRWNKHQVLPGEAVHVPSCAGTLVAHATFDNIGGYDDGMILYGGAEPEFGLRAWLSGHPVVAVPDLLVWHRFKNRNEISLFLEGLRPAITHNCLRFGLLYLPEGLLWQMLRYHANVSERTFPEAISRLESSDVWIRREQLRRRLPRNFEWFSHAFGLRDQIGRSISECPTSRGLA